MAWRAAVAAALAATTALVACSAAAPGAEPVRPAWREVALPDPGGRPVLRDAAWCAGRWYVVGAVVATDGSTAPAAWTSADARSWTRLPPAPATFYGRRGVLLSAACRAGALAALGARVGGVHGNPRVSTWRLAGSALVEEPAGFEVFGGPEAVGVGRMAAGPAGWLIVGNRSTGAAVWTSPDAARYDLRAGLPGLASDPAGATWAHDAVWTPGGWLVAGALTRPGRRDRDPLVWTSADGVAWARVAVPATARPEEAQRVAVAGDGTPVAVGPRGGGFGAWHRVGGRWLAAGRFGTAAASGVAAVRDLVAVRDGLVAAVSDGRTHALWWSGDLGRSWRRVDGPARVPAGGDTAVALAGDGRRLLALTDDGGRARMWAAPVPEASTDGPG